MSFKALAAASIFGLFSPAHAPVSPPAHQHFKVDGWVIRKDTDRFTGTRACTISRRHAHYEPGRLLLDLGPDIDTSQALYRIDGGPPFGVRTTPALAPDYRRLAVALRNPSQGQIAVPETQVLSAERIFVRAAPGAPIVSVRVEGLGRALDAAKTHGC